MSAWSIILTTMSIMGSLSAPPKAKWTVMVYMNADNNLEPDALINFKQMAGVGSTDEVNILVQFDRIGKYAHTAPDWSRTLRFRIEKDMQPIPRYALQDLGEADMGDTATIHDFVSWSKRKFPAERYILIIWDHGQGWRFKFAPSATASSAGGSLDQSPYRSISVDETNDNHKLYNRGIQEALATEKVDILGFDACLMAMVETAFAFRHIADYMVASEELIPGLGWDYGDWLQQLVAKPGTSPKDLARALVLSYERTYEQSDATTTLSAVDLSQIEPLAISVSDLGRKLEGLLGTQSREVFKARSKSYEYAPNHQGDGKNYFHHVDIGRFASQASAGIANNDIQALTARIAANLREAVVANYAGSARQAEYGSNGLAIYFPISGADYRDDPFEEGGYRKDNRVWPVEFVERTSWPDFLSAYFAKIR
jgi:Clostripain family